MLALWRILLRAIIRERDTYIAEKIRKACDGHQILDTSPGYLEDKLF